MFEGSAGPTSDPHVWPLSTTRHVKCIYGSMPIQAHDMPRHV